MCFFYAMSKDAQSLKNRYQLKLEFEFDMLAEPFNGNTSSEPGSYEFGLYEPSYYVSGFEYPEMPVITGDQPDNLQAFHWGLIPSWVKTPPEALEMRSHTLNARSETVFDKPAFRQAIRRQRCLVPAEGFYEWRLWAGKKYPYYIYCKDNAVFSFAGIWDAWTDRSSGEVLKTFSILTTEANPLLAKIHNTKKRMPVILPAHSERNWLRHNIGREEILSLTRPFDDDSMVAHPIGKLITSRTENRNSPAIQSAYHYPELDTL